jgi:hypothetical protein
MFNGMIIMRTLMFFLIFSMLTALVAQIDALIYKSNPYIELFTILRLDPGTNKWMVYVFLFCGFLYTIVTGIKNRLQRNRKNST